MTRHSLQPGELGADFCHCRAFNNAGSSIMDVVIGVLQDSTGNNSYTKVIYLVMSIKALAFFLGKSTSAIRCALS